jgi:RND family efflux transporter MFP subunit
MTVVSESVHALSPRRVRLDIRGAFVAASIVAAGACGGGAPPAGQGAPGGGMPAMPVEAVTLVPKPLDDVSEFVGVIKSRQSANIQPQAEGLIRAIPVKSGDHVTPGELLVDIDATSQQAAVANLQSIRAARESDLTLARQLAQRTKTLLDAGASSQQDYDSAVAAQKSAEAQLKATDDQIRQQQNELSYYHVTAPTAGIVGDIPVRVGDHVTKTTTLTTIDTNAGLEAYVYVPVQQAPKLHVGLPVRLLNDAGQTIETVNVTFVSPSVDEAQTVLAKAAVTGSSATFRTDQFVRADVVWSTRPGLTVPVTAVLRINGQDFVFKIENGPRGQVAHQQPVVLGSVVGNDYVVVDGLKAGDQLITGGIQKIGEGAPVHPMPPPAAPAQGGAAPAGGSK